MVFLFDFMFYFYFLGGLYFKIEIFILNMLLWFLMWYLGDKEEKYGVKVLKEIKVKFEDMIKVLMDMKNVS